MTFNILAFTKTQQVERVKIYLTKDKVALIKRAIILTKDISLNAMNEDMKYVFILENKRFKINNIDMCNVSKIRSNRFREAFNDIQSDVLEKVKYTAYNLRQMYKTAIYNEGSKENVSLIILEKLTGTKYKTDIKHYILSNDISLYAEIFSGVTISDVNIKGEIINEQQIDLLNPVEDGLGACKRECCEIDNMYKCLICTNFVTSVSRKNKFKNKIQANKITLQKDISEYQKNYLLSENKIYAAYYAEIIKLEGEQVIK